MNKSLSLLAAVAGLAFATPAMADDVTYKSKTEIKKSEDGDYTKKESAARKDDSGKVSSEAKTEIEVDAKGNVEKTVTTENVKDPKGLFNKEKVKTKDSMKTTAEGKVETEHKKTVNGKVVEHTKEEAPAAGH